MENTITNNAISASLLARNVYGVCFPQRDTMDALHSEFAAAREKFFTGGRKRVRVGRSEVVQGFDGKLKGKVSRRGLYWKRPPPAWPGAGPSPWRRPLTSGAATCWCAGISGTSS